MTAFKPQLVHESETQRQYVRMPMPVRVKINGGEYDAKDLSSGGLSLRGVEGFFTAGQKIPLTLIFPFQTFAIKITLDGEVRHHNAREKLLGLRFLDPNPDQIALLHHVLKAYMAGDMISASGLLSITTRENFVKTRRQAGPAGMVIDWKKQATTLGVVLVLGALAAIFIAGNIYQSLFTVKSQSAYISGPAVQVKSPAGGFFKSELAANAVTVKPGQAIGTILSQGSGDTPLQQVQVVSPCECYITEALKQNRESVDAGEALFSLTPVDGAPWVMADLEFRHATRLGDKNRATITIAGLKTQFTGQAVSIKADKNAPAADNQNAGQSGAAPRPVEIKIIPDQPIPVSLIGRPAQVTFPVH